MSDLAADDALVAIQGEQFSRLLAEEMAHDIELANSLNPNSWSFYRRKPGELIFVVEAIFVRSLTKNGGGLLVQGDADSPPFSSVNRAQTDLGFKYFPGFWIAAESTDRLASLSKEFRGQHEESIRWLASRVKTRTQRANEHQPAMLDALASAIGRVLPQPAYKAEEGETPRPSPPNGMPPGKRYWKISPGPKGKYWKEFRDRSLIAMHWSDTLEDLSAFPDDEPAFSARVKSDLGLSGQAAKSLWEFTKVIRVGDEVLAYANQAVIGFGTVTGNYELVGDDFKYMHRRRVSWASTDARPIAGLSPDLQSRLQTQATLFELTAEEFDEATRWPGPAKPVDPLRAIRGQFAASGLYFTDLQLATFYTALQTKAFVVLSGISGTGKSKLATGFVELLPNPAVVAGPSPDGGMISISVKPYMRTYRRVVLPARQVHLLPPLEIGQQTPIQVSLAGIQGNGRIEHRAQGGGASRMTLYFRGPAAEALAGVDVGTRLYVIPTLDGDGDAIESIALLRDDEFAPSDPWLSETDVPTKHLFLSVRPDWRDSTSLLGYYNPLTQTYEWTEFLRFILRAQKSFGARDGLAWFVILDEMNLAHVEYYFADLLSVIESGRNDEGWTLEPLRLTYPDTIDDEVPPHELRLPPNLYIVGTVNMDETTHAFSPKVLDRAFTIELADVDFTHYPIAGASSDGVTLGNGEKRQLLSAFTRGGRFARIDKGEIGQIVARYPRIRADLQALNELLRQDRMHFGYRVFDEICQYLFNNHLNNMMTIDRAFDQAVFMKVLPKFNGSRARLQSPLYGVLAWAVDPGSTSKTDVSAAIARFNAFYAGTADEAWATEPAFPAVAERVRDMLVALERDGFVSFG